MQKDSCGHFVRVGLSLCPKARLRFCRESQKDRVDIPVVRNLPLRAVSIVLNTKPKKTGTTTDTDEILKSKRYIAAERGELYADNILKHTRFAKTACLRAK